MMNNSSIMKIIFSLIALFFIVVLYQLFKFYTKKTQKKYKLKANRYFAIRRFLLLVFSFVFFIILIFIWRIDVSNMWISITGFIAMIAIAFFAVWSLIGNILAGLILYFTSPFKIDDTIEIMPDEIKGKVLAINSFFTLILDEDKNYINVPNSLLFQKYLKSIKSKVE